MVRDFSLFAAQNALNLMSQTIEVSTGDAGSSLSSGALGAWVDKLGIGVYLDKVEQFNRVLLEKTESAKRTLWEVYESVWNSDNACGLTMSDYLLVLQQWMDYINGVGDSVQGNGIALNMITEAYLSIDLTRLSEEELHIWQSRLPTIDPSLLSDSFQAKWGVNMVDLSLREDAVWKGILSKDGEDILPVEYEVLALVYAELEPVKLEDFIKECMVCTSNREITWKNWSYGTSSYSEWIIDETKYKKLRLNTQFLYELEIYALHDKNGADRILQRNTLLDEVFNLGVCRGDFVENETAHVGPNLEVKFIDDNSDGRGDYVLTCTQREEGMMTYLDPWTFAADDYFLKQNLEITVHAAVRDEALSSKAISQHAIALNAHFCNNPDVVGIASNQLGALLTEETITTVMALYGITTVPSLVVSAFVAAGLGVVEYEKQLAEKKENQAFISQQIYDLGKNNVYKYFDCNVTFVTRKVTTDYFETTTYCSYAGEGESTRARLDLFNRTFNEHQITIEELIENPEKAYEEINAVSSEIDESSYLQSVYNEIGNLNIQ